MLGEAGYGLVWGASDKGLMRVFALAAKQSGARLTGITIPIYKSSAGTYADEVIIAKDLYERKSLMLERSDAFAILPGGVGSLDEATEMMELKKQGVHSKPIVFISIDEFYDGLKNQFKRMNDEGFLTRPAEEFAHFSDGPSDAMEYLNKELGA